MKDDKNIMTNSILETAESASAYAEARMEEVRSEYQKRKIKLMKISGMMILTSIMLIFATRSWFTMSRSVEGTDASMTAADLPFDIKTVGYYGYYDDYLPTEYTKLNKTTNAPGATSGTLTTGSSSSIQWLITADKNTNNYITSSTKEDAKGIRPGTSGEMKFWIVPKESETINIRFKLSIDPYKANYKLDASGNIITDENNIPLQNAPTSIANDSNYATVISYLKSHVLFFKRRNPVKKSDNTTFSHYIYSDLIPLDTEFNLVFDDESETYVNTLTFTLDGSEYQDEPFYIYWVWPETLAEAVLPETMQNNGKHSLCPDGEIFDEFKKNPALFLNGYNSTDDTNGTANADLTQALVYQYYSKLSLEYNNADQEIGDNIGYFVLELNAIG